METYVKSLINSLYEHFNYSIFEFEAEGLCSNWGIYKKTALSTEVIFFTDLEGSYKVNLERIKAVVRDKLELDNIRLIHVIIDGKLNIKTDENGTNHINHPINPQCELILINNVDNKLLYFSEGIQHIAQEVAAIMNHKDVNSAVTKKPIITYVLICVNVFVYLITALLSGSVMDSNINVLVFLGAKVNSLINQGQYYRLITCMFLHGGIIHLLANMYSLNSLGPLIEEVYGKSKFTFIYFLSGIIASIFSYIFSTSVSIGASGAIFGLLGAALVFGIRMKNKVGRGFMMNIVSVIALNLFMGFSIPNVDNFGHIGGLIGGIGATLVLRRK